MSEEIAVLNRTNLKLEMRDNGIVLFKNICLLLFIRTNDLSLLEYQQEIEKAKIKLNRLKEIRLSRNRYKEATERFGETLAKHTNE